MKSKTNATRGGKLPAQTDQPYCERCGDVLDNGHGKDFGGLLVCDLCYRRAVKKTTGLDVTTAKGQAAWIERENAKLSAPPLPFTAGPWELRERPNMGGGKIPDANARLVAAAPELFAIVKDYADNADCGDGGQGEACAAGTCWHCQAVAMVAKIIG